MNDSVYGHAHVTPIALDALASQVPAAFSDHAARRTSASYVFISTRELVTALLEAGFVATHARQARARRGDGAAYAQHMLCFQPQRDVVSLVDAIPQIVLINSHDGCCSYQLRAGLYRPFCTNGLLTRLGDFGLIHVPHRGNVVANVVDAALAITRDFSRIGEVVEQMHRTSLSFDERVAFAARALELRYPAGEHQPFTAQALLSCRRPADEAPDLWHVFNVVQENLLRGGISGRSANGRCTRSRAIQAIRQDVRINNDLWQLAMSLIRQ
jgi:hypothetical protein